MPAGEVFSPGERAARGSTDAGARRAWIQAGLDRAAGAGLDRWADRLRPLRNLREP